MMVNTLSSTSVDTAGRLISAESSHQCCLHSIIYARSDRTKMSSSETHRISRASYLSVPCHWIHSQTDGLWKCWESKKYCSTMMYRQTCRIVLGSCWYAAPRINTRGGGRGTDPVVWKVRAWCHKSSHVEKCTAFKSRLPCSRGIKSVSRQQWKLSAYESLQNELQTEVQAHHSDLIRTGRRQVSKRDDCGDEKVWTQMMNGRRFVHQHQICYYGNIMSTRKKKSRTENFFLSSSVVNLVFFHKSSC